MLNMNSLFNKTKIVATMGPATADIAVLELMFIQGLDICRINFSHGDYSAVEQTVNNIHTLNKKLNYHVGILADLQGPKLRIGVIKDKVVKLENGKDIVITTTEQEGDANRIYITYPNFPKDVSAPNKISPLFNFASSRFFKMSEIKFLRASSFG